MPTIAASDPPTWYVDPIDGTQNFCTGLPVAAVSIGLAVDGHPVLGVIYDPYRGPFESRTAQPHVAEPRAPADLAPRAGADVRR